MEKAFLDIQIQWQQQSYRLAQESEFKFQISKIEIIPEFAWQRNSLHKNELYIFYWHRYHDIFEPVFSFILDRSLSHKHGTGPYNVFILDTSSSLGQNGYKQTKEIFTDILEGKYCDELLRVNHLMYRYSLRQRVIFYQFFRVSNTHSTDNTIMYD